MDEMILSAMLSSMVYTKLVTAISSYHSNMTLTLFPLIDGLKFPPLEFGQALIIMKVTSRAWS